MVDKQLRSTMKFLVFVLIILCLVQLVLTGTYQAIVSIITLIYTVTLAFIIFYRIYKHEL